MKAIVFRLQLFKPSEVFITAQCLALKNYTPVMLGREIHGLAPDGLEYYCPPGNSKIMKVSQALLGAEKFYQQTLQNSAQYNLVHAHFGVDAAAVMRVTTKLDLPLVTTFHGFDATTKYRQLLSSGSPSLMRYAFRRSELARRGDLFICVSEFIKNKVLALGFPEEKVVKHFIGTDICRFSSLQRLPNQDRPIVLHVARLVEKKGTLFLIKAFARLRHKVPDARLVIIGEGPLRASLEKFVAESGLTEMVTFLGVQPHAEVLLWLSRARIFALPSVTASSGDTEGLPISIIEASAARLPVVATWHSGIPEAVEHEKSGLLSAEKDVDTLAEHLTQLLLDQEMCISYGAAGQKFVADNFDIERQGERLEDLYRRVDGS
jgi:colanic acid/amylovoran biosynthesis glycosyltransferase